MGSFADLHQRYLLQSSWTAENRRRLFQQADLEHASRLLEVGCGTGALTHELSALESHSVCGLDIDAEAVSFAHSIDRSSDHLVGDGFRLPFSERTFDIVFCHYLLLWIANPVGMLLEMARVARSSGAILALAEPDYGGRIDHPETLEELGRLQAVALANQGVDIHIGRRLRMLFSQAGLRDVCVGILGGEWRHAPDLSTLASEWEMFRDDLAGSLSKKQLAHLEQVDREAWLQGNRILFVPTFYAIGRVG